MSASKFGLAQWTLLAALAVTSGGISAAQAADLGGNCCADLEERIAELEATTARKGNRKVSLEVSGHVNEAILWWDDGVESNAGVYTNDNARSRFRFKGDAKINDDWKAGYLLEIGVRSANSKRFDQDEPNPRDEAGLDVRHSAWFVKSKTFGALWMGLTGGASEGITEINLAATKDVLKYSDQEDNALGLETVVNGAYTGLAWRRLIRGGGDQPGEGKRYNMVRYDTPELAGFHGTANWGEDDAWEVGLRYKGEFGDFKVAAGIAYGENSDVTSDDPAFQCVGNDGPDSDRDCKQLGGSVSVMHTTSGLYVNFAAGYLDDELIASDAGAAAIAAVAEDRSTFYAIEAGIERKFFDHGKTTIFGQYYKNDGGSQDRDFNGLGDIVESKLESYGVGIVQGIDAAAMHVYLTYRHYEGDVTAGAALTNEELDDLDVVMSGAIIRF
jgi:predicted porin